MLNFIEKSVNKYKGLLNQFDKKDLINGLLEESIEGDDYATEEEFNKLMEENEDKQESKDVINKDETSDIITGDEDELDDIL